jgi:Streptomyces sporulation and cell division protein, SsgA
MPSRWTSGHSSPITLQLVGPQSWTEVPALLCYDPTDPFAVRIAFGDVGDENDLVDVDEAGIAWLVSRELLQSGLDRPSGEGDVRVWPAHGATDVLFLHLRAPSGEALFELSRATVAAFLRQTEALVPSGSESGMLALDEELQALLSGGGADPTGR